MSALSAAIDGNDTIETFNDICRKDFAARLIPAPDKTVPEFREQVSQRLRHHLRPPATRTGCPPPGFCFLHRSRATARAWVIIPTPPAACCKRANSRATWIPVGVSKCVRSTISFWLSFDENQN
ncbi:hypothetical protein RPB_4669 [Rhodopseudomonas palustris HaA2]|uniref:Uncharacterized protein n=1 Tax=Rhodopseudomonas palustris (strain HaA2) TaxID=316058 RepID=Q2IR08_RHOP2|nr:hypothetical protein RPB_4669 [Rhodopseudomonas palustris HaA2]